MPAHKSACLAAKRTATRAYRNPNGSNKSRASFVGALYLMSKDFTNRPSLDIALLSCASPAKNSKKSNKGRGGLQSSAAVRIFMHHASNCSVVWCTLACAGPSIAHSGKAPSKDEHNMDNPAEPSGNIACNAAAVVDIGANSGRLHDARAASNWSAVKTVNGVHSQSLLMGSVREPPLTSDTMAP